MRFVPSFILIAALATAVHAEEPSAASLARNPPADIGQSIGQPVSPHTAQTQPLNQPPQTQPQPQGLDQQILQWGGLRPKLAERGITLENSLISDFSRDFTGGNDAGGNTFRYLLDLRLNLDMDKLAGIHGGTFSIKFQQQGGPNGTDRLGDSQGYDNIDADGRTQIAEVWYEQWLLDKKVRIKIGKVDANSEFAFPEYGGEFINSSFGFSPTIVNMPTYPDPAASLNVFVYPTPWLYVGYGIYNGALAEGISTGKHSSKSLFQGPADYFQIGEVGVRWKLGGSKLPGRFAVGGYYENAGLTTFAGTQQHGTAGGYLILEQQLLKTTGPREDDSDRGVYSFLQFAWADEHVSEVAQHLGAGLVWVGPYAKDNPDTLGVGFSTAYLSQDPGAGFTRHAETSIEVFYGYQATSWLNIKPDLQYIIHPGGDAEADDALVGTMRVTLTF